MSYQHYPPQFHYCGPQCHPQYYPTLNYSYPPGAGYTPCQGGDSGQHQTNKSSRQIQKKGSKKRKGTKEVALFILRKMFRSGIKNLMGDESSDED